MLYIKTKYNSLPTGLASDKNNLSKLQKLLQRLNAKEMQIIPLQQGQKNSYFGLALLDRLH